MAKKITIFLFFILIGSAIFLIGYSFSQTPPATDQQALINNSLVSRFEKNPERRTSVTGLIQLSKGAAAFPTLSTDGKEIRYYVPKSGEIRSVSVKDLNNGSVLVSTIVPNANQISWSINRILIATYDHGPVYYDLSAGLLKKLNPKIKNPVLSKTGDNVAYINFDDKEQSGTIRISDSKFEDFKNIMPTHLGSWKISWINDHLLSLVKPPESNGDGSWLFNLDIQTKSLDKILEAKTNLQIAWSPDGQKLIYSYTDPSTNSSNLYLMDPTDKIEHLLKNDLNANKCVWSIDNKTVYCAGVNSFLSFDTTLPELSPKTITIPTNYGVIDLENATGLFLTSSENFIIFQDATNGKLYGLPFN